MENIQKEFREIDSFQFDEFFGLNFFNFSGPLCPLIYKLGVSKFFFVSSDFLLLLGCELGHLMGTPRPTQKQDGMLTYFSDVCWFSAICPWQSSQHHKKTQSGEISKHSI